MDEEVLLALDRPPGIPSCDALDGQSQQGMVQRLKQERAEEYRPEGGWRVRGR